MNGLLIITAPDTGDEWELRKVDDDDIDGAIVDLFLSRRAAPVTLAVSGDHGFIGAWRWDGDDAWRATECPRCGSPRADDPTYAATLCSEAWHCMPIGRNDIDVVTRLRGKLTEQYPGRAGWWTR